MKYKIAFFGTDSFSTAVLDELKLAELTPNLIVTTPDRPKGRGLKMTPSETKIWAKENDKEVMTPEKLDVDFIEKLKTTDWDLFVVASYGKIIPKEILDLPKYGSLNVHPSLLPLYRGASPIESAILNDSKETGVTIIKMDEKMDHGPILNQDIIFYREWPDKVKIEEELAHIGGSLLAETIPQWIEGQILPQEQEHDKATLTKKIEKTDGEIDLNANPYQNFLKIKALNPWPGTFFFKDDKRIKITKADFVDGKLEILKVIPEGKKEMDYRDFLRN